MVVRDHNPPLDPPRPSQPYVGPRPFEEADREDFFGREQEVRQLLSLVVARRAVLLYSPSGAGKTSLLQAGLLPRLRALRGAAVLPIARVGDPAPAAAGTGNVYAASTLCDLLEEEAESGELQGLTLAAGLARYLAREPEKVRRRPHFLIFDQFEELFTTHPDRYPERADFLHQLRDGLASHPQITLLLAMREEYVAHIHTFRALLPDHLRTRFRLEPLSEKAALSAIVEPARRAGVTFHEAAARALVDDLRTMRVQAADGTTRERLGPHVDPVQLQVVCRRLWERRPGGAAEIDRVQVEAVGSVDHALADYYAEQVAAVAGTTGFAERTVREWIERHLITEQGIRGQVLRQADCTQGLADEAIQGLVASHLVRAEERRGATWFELAHDRLIEPIRADNRAWRETHLSTLERRAAVWEGEKRSADLLLAGAELAAAERWAAARSDLPQVERDFLDASLKARAAAEREKRQTRLLRRWAVAATLFFVLAVVALAVALVKSQAAQEAKIEAERQAEVSTSRRLAAQALYVLDEQLDLALLLALEACRIYPSVEARGSLLIGLEHDPYPLRRRLEGHESAVRSVAFSPDGRWLASAGNDGTVRLWDVATGQLRGKPLRGHGAAVRSVAFSPDGRWLASAGDDQTVRLWDPVTRQSAGEPLVEHRSAVLSVAFSPDGKRMASGSEDGEVILWEMATRRRLAPLTAHEGAVLSVAFSPDGKWLASGSQDGKLILGEALSGHRGAVRSVAFSSDGSLLASGSQDRTVVVWDPERRQSLHVLSGQGAEINAVAFSHKGRWLVAGSRDGTILVWDLATPEPLANPLPNPGSAVMSVAYSPDGRWLAWGSETGNVTLLDVDPESWHAWACRIANRNLTLQEWHRFIGPGTAYRRTCTELPAGAGVSRRR